MKEEACDLDKTILRLQSEIYDLKEAARHGYKSPGEMKMAEIEGMRPSNHYGGLMIPALGFGAKLL